jgi:hypothetical protein
MGYRSVSAEIDLEKGEYEVLPKISAYRDSDKPFVEDVVKKYADTNSQKLRQIGMNHDIANAKGLEPEDVKALDEMQKEAEVEAEKADEKPKKKKRKSDVKKEKEVTKEKAEPESEDKGESADTKPVPEKPVDSAESKDSTVESTAKEPASESVSKELVVESVSKEPTVEAAPKEPVVEAAKTGTKSEDQQDKKEPEAEKAGEAKEDEKNDDSSDDGKSEPGKKEDPSEEDDGEDHGIKNPWNAVCIIGLRVYSKHANTEIAITTPNDAQASSLVDQSTSAGATAA